MKNCLSFCGLRCIRNSLWWSWVICFLCRVCCWDDMLTVSPVFAHRCPPAQEEARARHVCPGECLCGFWWGCHHRFQRVDDILSPPNLFKSFLLLITPEVHMHPHKQIHPKPTQSCETSLFSFHLAFIWSLQKFCFISVIFVELTSCWMFLLTFVSLTWLASSMACL